jgi:rhodanese-related sulfurtransferase
MQAKTSKEETSARSLLPAFFRVALLLACVFLLRISIVEASHGREEINYIPPERVRALLDGGEKIIFIDIRPAKDFQERRIAGARSFPLPALEKRLGEIPKAGRVVVYCNCQAGAEDGDAYFILRDNGYRNAAVMEEGFPGWLRRKYPVESGASK